MKFIPELDFYSYLGLENLVSLEAVKAKYRELVKIHHPDRGGDIEKMKKINHIYDVMKNGKAIYDNWLRKQLVPAVQGGIVYPDWSNAWNEMARQQAASAATTASSEWSFTFGGF